MVGLSKRRVTNVPGGDFKSTGQYVPNSAEMKDIMKEVWAFRPSMTNTKDIDYKQLSAEIKRDAEASFPSIVKGVGEVLGSKLQKKPILHVADDIAVDKGPRKGTMDTGDDCVSHVRLISAESAEHARQIMAHELVHIYLLQIAPQYNMFVEEALCTGIANYLEMKASGEAVDNRTMAQVTLEKVRDNSDIMEFIGFVAERTHMIDERSALKKFYRAMLENYEIDNDFANAIYLTKYVHSNLALAKFLLANPKEDVPELFRRIAKDPTIMDNETYGDSLGKLLDVINPGKFERYRAALSEGFRRGLLRADDDGIQNMKRLAARKLLRGMRAEGEIAIGPDDDIDAAGK